MEEAAQAIKEGNSPFGAVLADLEGTAVGAAHSATNTDHDPTAHAELKVIREVAQKLQRKDLSGFCLVSNAQSCPMCFSAAVQARITHFIYGFAEDETLVPAADVFEMSTFCKEKIIIETGVLKDECERQIKQARSTI